jgi:CRP-like cAMP-binding protein
MPYQSENHLLATLNEADFAALQPHLEWTAMPVRKMAEAAKQQITHIYFPVSGIVSVTAVVRNDREIEVGLIGREGMTGLAVLLDDGSAANRSVVQIAGQAWSITASQFRAEVENSPGMQRTFLRYANAFCRQVSQTALANGRGSLSERLARWLLMCLDRMDTTSIPLTHQLIAVMLGVRRAGVTQALRELETRGMIERSRGAIVVGERGRLETLANGLYGVPEAELRRWTG